MRFSNAGLLLATLLSSLLIVAFAFPAIAYDKQPLAKILLSGPSVVRCNQSATIGVRVVGLKSGKPLKLQTVNFRLVTQQSGRDRLNKSQGRTNLDGSTSLQLSFGPAAGPRSVRATIPNYSTTITVRCAGGLPKTSVLPPADFVENPPAIFVDEAIAPPPPVDMTMPTPATAIRLQRIGIDVPLVEGDGYTVPDAAVAHYPDTAWPGEGSNTYVYGHAREGQFLELWKVRTGDIVEVDMADGSSVNYSVSQILPLVHWDALEYLEPTDHEILTLQTCLGYEETAPRFVVIAERIPSA